jgi:hypothetical protein
MKSNAACRPGGAGEIRKRRPAVNAVNRFFVAILALGWIALMGAIAYLVWNPGEFVEISGSTLNARFEVLLDTTAEQTLASIVIGLLMLPAVMLLLMEATVHDRRAGALSAEARTERDRSKQLESRVHDLEGQLDSERKRDAATVRTVAEREERAPVYEPEHSRVTASRRWHLFGR